MTPRIFVSRDSTSQALGLAAVLEALDKALQARGISIEQSAVGSRGAYWLEPMIEVQTQGGRVGYGPLAPQDIAGLVEAGMLEGKPHAKCIGLVDAHPWFAQQTRITFARCGIVDPLALDSYAAHGGLAGLRRALALTQEQIIEQVIASGLRGRGGAGFPAGIKWRAAQQAPGGEKYIVCNADEGDSGTFADRMLMEGDPFCLIEGMAIAGLAVGALNGFIYLRSEYPNARLVLLEALKRARAAQMIGPDILGSGRAFDIELRMGAGAYICGEESALLESLEGKRGQVRARPPLPVQAGLFGKPTVVNNVLTLATIPVIIDKGGAWYAALGQGKSRGTQPFQLAGNIARGGLVELPFGISARDLIERWGGGTRSGRKLRAVQIGGPLGAYFPDRLLDTAMDYEALVEAGGLLGHGGLVAFDDSVDMAEQARFAMEFCAHESCGKCTPCRIGSVRGMEVIDRISSGHDRATNLSLLGELCETLREGSLCALGGLTPLPVESAVRYFPDDFARPRRPGGGKIEP